MADIRVRRKGGQAGDVSRPDRRPPPSEWRPTLRRRDVPADRYPAPVGATRRKRGAAWWEKPLMALVPLALLALFGLLLLENRDRPADSGAVPGVAATAAATQVGSGAGLTATPVGAVQGAQPDGAIPRAPAVEQAKPTATDTATTPAGGRVAGGATAQPIAPAGGTPTTDGPGQGHGATPPPASESVGAGAAAASGPAAQEGEPPDAASAGQQGTEDVITALPLGQPDRLVSLVGRRARLTNVRVQEVVGDSTFWIGPSPTRRILVFLEEDKGSEGEAEGGVEVRSGQIVNMAAGVRRLPSPEEIRREWDLDPEILEELELEQVYLYVENLADFRIVAEP